MAKVFEDCHGLYIKVGGYIFRPIYPIGYNHIYIGNTKLNKGDNVKAKHIGGSPLSEIKVNETKEYWFSHGEHSDKLGKRINSENVYKPIEYKWQ